MIVLTVALGLLIGLIMGALGGGGSILTVPVLVFVLGMSAQEATTASLVIVGITAIAATTGHARSGHTRWRPGLLLVLLGVPASLLGTRLNQQVDENVLLLAFAALMLIAATGMLRRARSSDQGDQERHADRPGQDGHDGGTSSGDQSAPPRTSTGSRPALRRAVTLTTAGLAIGFLTGFLGVGGGFVIVPVLVLLLRMPMPVAVGTSLLVIGLNSAVALAARVAGTFSWDVIVPFTVAAVAGSVAGEKLAKRLSADKLTVAFAVLLLVVAVYVAVQAAIGLA